jgi:hypothetical protein
MRILAIAAVAALFAAQSVAFAAPDASSARAVHPQSTFELVKAGHKVKGKKHHHKGKKGAAPGKCGTGKYYSKGKCLSASDKKPK